MMKNVFAALLIPPRFRLWRALVPNRVDRSLGFLHPRAARDGALRTPAWVHTGGANPPFPGGNGPTTMLRGDATESSDPEHTTKQASEEPPEQPTKRPAAVRSKELTEFLNEHGKDPDFRDELAFAITECGDISGTDRRTLAEFFGTLLEDFQLDEATLASKETEKTGSEPPSGVGSFLTCVGVLERVRTLVSEVNLKSIQIIGKNKNGEYETVKREEDDITAAIKRLNGGNFKFFLFIKGDSQESRLIWFDDDYDGWARTSKVDEMLVKIGAIPRKIPTIAQVKKTLSAQLDDYAGTSSILPYNKDLVSTDKWYQPVFIPDMSRVWAWVVTGESGSGKSMYGINMFPGATVLRYSLADSKSGIDIKPPRKYSPTLKTFLKLAETHINKNDLGPTDLWSFANFVNLEIGIWARRKAEEMLQYAVDKTGCSSVKDWYAYRDITLDKLVIVFDDCEMSPEFVSGIIQWTRRLLTDLKHEKYAKELALVLCGTGLEYEYETGPLGSDPPLGIVITMLGTNLDSLKDEALRNAIKKGVYSRILASNARMLVHGILPVLNSGVLNDYTDDTVWDTKSARLQAFCSFRSAMDFSVRAYLQPVDEKQRNKLLDKSFRYMLKSALKSIPEAHRNAAATLQIEAMEAVDGKDEGDEEDIFRIGLATQDPSKTSNALRYLACKGTTAPPYSVDGMTFGNIVAIHLHRYSESLGTNTGFKELRSAWPPAPPNNTELNEKEVQARVSEMLTKGSADVQMIVDFFNEATTEADGGSAALVLRQEAANAQGPDVLKLEAKLCEDAGAERKVLELSAYRAKNWIASRHERDVSHLAKSLGVDRGQNDREPVSGSAGYAYRAMLALCQAAAARLGREPIVADRVIVFACKAWKRSENDENLLQLWSQEMLEPTISAFVVAPDEDEQEPLICDHEND